MNNPGKRPFAIPHDLDNFLPTPSDTEGLDVVQFFLGWFSMDVPDDGVVARTKDNDYTIRRMVHSYERVLDLFNQAIDVDKEFEFDLYDVLAHAIYLAEGLTFLAIKFKAEMEGLDKNDEPWKDSP